MFLTFRKNAANFLKPSFAPKHIPTGNVANDLLARGLRICFFTDASIYGLVTASCLILFASTWLLISPGVVYSRTMTWDLLFILEGAWRAYTGQVLHVDFHYPLGTLPFTLTELGFYLVGVKPIAFVVGECVLAGVLAIFAILAVKDRLPALPGFLFIYVCVMLVLVPGNISNYSFAMGYNRFGWSAVTILCLLLFIEPRGGRDPVWTDLPIAGILTVGLFFVKITYFEVAVGAISLALLISRHVRRYWRGWCGILLFVFTIAFAPINHGYRSDIACAIASGHIASDPEALAVIFVLNIVVQLFVFGGILALLCLRTLSHAKLADVVAGGYIWISGLFLLSQNTQLEGIPVYVVLALLLSTRIGDWLQSNIPRPSMLILFIMTWSLLPLLPTLFSESLALAGYNIAARKSSKTFVVTTTNLRGLAVPLDDDGILDEAAAGRDTRDSFSRIRASGRNGLELSDREYITTVLALADFLRAQEAASARIVVIDQVNPLPFVLGAPAPRGGNLWSGDIGWQAADEALGDAEYVAIPRFPTQRATLIEGLKAYQEYLSTRLVRRWETPYWTVLERRKRALE